MTHPFTKSLLLISSTPPFSTHIPTLQVPAPGTTVAAAE
jgi:hypothetical protein